MRWMDRQVESLRYVFEDDEEPRLTREEVWMGLAWLGGSTLVLCACAVLGQVLA